MDAIQTYLEKAGTNFLVAAIIPSLAFVTIAMVAFEPILPDAVIARLGGTFNPLGKSGIMALLFSVILGFTISSLNIFLLKVYEGIVILWRLPWFRRHQQRRARKLKRKQERLQKRIDRLENAIDARKNRSDREERKSSREERLLDSLNAENFYLKQTYELNFPPHYTGVLPTGFGNILKAAEAYARSRYSIDSVPVWPRLIHVIPDSYYVRIQQSNNELSFLVNCSFLSGVFAILSLMAALYQYYVANLAAIGVDELLYFNPLVLDPDIYYQRAGLYLGVFVLTVVVTVVFNRAALLLVNTYGNMIRSAYDLFRSSLLTQLNLPLPKDSVEEQDIWSMVSESMVVMDIKNPLYFEYEYHKNEREAEPTRGEES
jgi:hypothetical protein